MKYRIFSAILYFAVSMFLVADAKVFTLKDYPNVKICNGEMTGNHLHFADPDSAYRRIREMYENCTHVIGNLMITDLTETNGAGKKLDYSFFKSIVEVNGVVLIRGNSVKRLPLENLRVIRGLTTYAAATTEKLPALYIGMNNHFQPQQKFREYLHELDLRSLVSIVHGDVKIDSNPGLCYIPNTIDWGYIVENSAVQKITLQSTEYNVRFCKEYVDSLNITGTKYVERSGISCHESCPLIERNGQRAQRYCWGPGPNQCQKIVQCSKKCPKSVRCYHNKVTGEEKCCHTECTGGCTGDTQRDCVACKNFLNDKECVTQCPPKEIYNPYKIAKEPNPNHRLSFGSFCVKKCPRYSLIKDDACEATCDLHNNYLKDGRHCLPCKGDICKTNCFLDDIMESLKDKKLKNLAGVVTPKTVLKRLKGCTQVQGTLKLTNASFTAVKNNITHELPRYEDLMNLKDVKVWIGPMHMDLHGFTDLKNLSFLSNLETIRAFDNGLQLSRASLEFLGLTSLKYVVVEKLLIIWNQNLCYMENFNKDRFKYCYYSLMVLSRNQAFNSCEAENRTCDQSCLPKKGCWGPGPGMCVECRRRKAGDVCVDKCTDVPGFFEDKVTKKCEPCHPECRGPCSGTGPDHCIGGCVHGWLNGTCVESCPEHMYLEKSTTHCLPCSPNCAAIRAKRLCNGPDNVIGPNGCNFCQNVEVEDLPKKRIKRCVKGCQKEGFFESMLDAQYLPESFRDGAIKPVACKPCNPMCLVCRDGGIHNCARCRHYNYKGECRDSCPPEDTYEKDNGTCQTCDSACRSGCFGPGPTNCNACKVRKIYLNPERTAWQCNSSCPAEQSYAEFEEETGDTVCIKKSSALSRQTRMVIIYSSIGVPGILCVVVLIIVCVCVQRRRALVKERELLEMKFLRQLEEQQVPLNETDQEPNFNQLRIIGANQLTKGYEIGSGAFGTVFLGTWRPIKEKPTDAQLEIKVAIKTLKDSGGDGFSAAVTNEFLSEAHVMASVDHPACIRLLGVCLSSQMQLISEFMPLGSLADFLPKHKHELGSQQLLTWAVQIAQGMAYLETHGIVHRDLAARNVLLQSMQQIRITDFGLAKLMDDEENGEFTAEGGRFPVKWLAIECLRRRLFSHKSDVWAFGVTLWELCSLGQRPYADVRATELIDFLERGERLQQPDICTLDMYMLMIKCWLLDPDSRPTFEELVTDLRKKAADPARYLVIPNDTGRLGAPMRSNSAVSSSGTRHVSPNPVRSRSVTPDVSRLGAVSVSSDDANRKPVARGPSGACGFAHLTDAVNRRKAESPMRRLASEDTRYAADPMLREDSNEVFADYLTPTDEDPQISQEPEDYLEADIRPSVEYYNETGGTPRESDSSVAYVNTDVLDCDDYLNPQGLLPTAHNPVYTDPAQTALLDDQDGEENGYLMPIELTKPRVVDAVHNPQYLAAGPKREPLAYMPVLPRSNRSTPNKDLV